MIASGPNGDWGLFHLFCSSNTTEEFVCLLNGVVMEGYFEIEPLDLNLISWSNCISSAIDYNLK